MCRGLSSYALRSRASPMSRWGKEGEAVVTKAMETIVTGTAAAIVTALGEGPSSALDLSQRLSNVTHVNARQTLRRLAEAGIVTRLRRGLYAVSRQIASDGPTSAKASVPKSAKPSAGCDGGGPACVPSPVTTASAPAKGPFPAELRGSGHKQDAEAPGHLGRELPRRRVYSDDEVSAAVTGAWKHFELMNDPHNPEAWA